MKNTRKNRQLTLQQNLNQGESTLHLAHPPISLRKGLWTPQNNKPATPLQKNLDEEDDKRQSLSYLSPTLYIAQAKDPHHAHHAPTNIKSESSSKVSYPLTDFVSFHRLSPQLQAYLDKVASETKPLSNEEAMRDPRWNNSVTVEFDALELNHTWDVTDLPPGKVAIGCKWVFRIKFRVDGSIERFKTRLVVLENRQQEGVNYK